MASQPMQLQSLPVDDFSGGITDRHVAGRTNQYQAADNFIIRNHSGKGKLKTRPGSQLHNTLYPLIPGANVRLVDIEKSEEQIFQFSARNVYYVSGGMLTLLGPSSNPALNAGTVSNYLSKAKWNKHLLLTNDARSQPVKIFNDGSWRVRTLGLPAISTSAVTITPGVVSTQSFIYTFIRSDSYSIGTITYREVSATALKAITTSSAPNVSSNTIAVLPVLINGATGNYNTTTSKIEIYRTTNAGTTSYKVGEVTNGTTSFVDSMSDATLVLQELLYTTGGVVDYEQPDPSAIVIVCNDTAWYMDVVESGVNYPQRVRQSIQGALYASPRSFYKDLDSAIIGAGSIGQSPIVFCKSGKIYRLEGLVDDQGRGDVQAIEISNTVALLSHRSIVPAKDGLFFAAESGFYYTLNPLV